MKISPAESSSQGHQLLVGDLVLPTERSTCAVAGHLLHHEAKGRKTVTRGDSGTQDALRENELELH